MNNRGFSLLELMLVMAILAIVSTTVGISFFGYQRQAEVDAASGTIADTLRDAQSRSISGKDFKKWGVYFDDTANSNKFILFRDDGSGYGGAIVKEENGLPSAVRINSASIAGGCNEIIFNNLGGGTTQDCAIKIEEASGGDNLKTITVTSMGKIERQ